MVSFATAAFRRVHTGRHSCLSLRFDFAMAVSAVCVLAGTFADTFAATVADGVSVDLDGGGCSVEVAFHCLFTPFHCLSLTFQCLSLTFHCLSLAFHCHSHRLQEAVPSPKPNPSRAVRLDGSSSTVLSSFSLPFHCLCTAFALPLHCVSLPSHYCPSTAFYCPFTDFSLPFNICHKVREGLEPAEREAGQQQHAGARECAVAILSPPAPCPLRPRRRRPPPRIPTTSSCSLFNSIWIHVAVYQLCVRARDISFSFSAFCCTSVVFLLPFCFTTTRSCFDHSCSSSGGGGGRSSRQRTASAARAPAGSTMRAFPVTSSVVGATPVRASFCCVSTKDDCSFLFLLCN